MRTSLLSLLAVITTASALPTTQNLTSAVLSLVKLSPESAPIWVTDEQKDAFALQNVHFIDITYVVDNDFLTSLTTPANQTITSSISRRAITYPRAAAHQTTATPYLTALSPTLPRQWLKNLTTFHTRHYRSTTGIQSAIWLHNLLTTLTAAHPNITVHKFPHRYKQPSLIVTIPGTTEDLVVLGAHFDSTGSSPTARSPGAEDNASGVVTLLETLRVLTSVNPDTPFTPYNTLEFHFYSGEEGGLLGSTDIWTLYKAVGASVIAFLNQDMTGYSPSGKISIYNDYVDRELTAYARVIAKAYTGVETTEDTCGYACSDHGAAYAAGFPAAYACDEPEETAFQDVHSSADKYEVVDFDTVIRHAKFTVGFAIEASAIKI